MLPPRGTTPLLKRFSCLKLVQPAKQVLFNSVFQRSGGLALGECDSALRLVRVIRKDKLDVSKSHSKGKGLTAIPKRSANQRKKNQNSVYRVKLSTCQNSTTSEHFQKWPKNQGVVLALSLSILPLGCSTFISEVVIRI